MRETTRSESTTNRPHDLDGRAGRVLLAVALLAAAAAPAPGADYAWSSGYYSASGFPTTISAADSLYMTGSLINLDVTLTNNGHVYWVGGDVPSSGGHFVNNGTVVISADGQWGYGGGPSSSFTNYGTVYKTGGAGSTVFNSSNQFFDEFTFVNSGAIVVQAGTVEYESPITRFLAGTELQGAGNHVVTAYDARFEGPFTVAPDSHLRLEGPQVTSTTASTTFTGTVTWAGGDLRGPWAIPAGSTLAVVSGTTKRFDDADVTCSGTLTVADTLHLSGGATMVNDGVVDLLGDHVIVYGGGNGCVLDNLAAGTIRKSGGLGAGGIDWGNHGWDELLFYNWGTLDAQVGTLAYSNPGTHLLDGTLLTGAGAHRVTMYYVTFGGSVTAATPLVVDVGGPLTGEAAVLHGSYELRSGDLTNSWTLATDGTLNVVTGGAKRISGGTFTNQGTVNLQATLPLSAATLLNQGLVDILGAYTLAYGGGDWPTVTNQGTIRSSGGGASGVGYQVAFSNEVAGTLDLQAGTFTCESHSFSTNAGAIRAASGATLAMPGTLTNLGAVTGSGTLQLPSLVNQGVVSPGSPVGALTLTGAFTQSGLGALALDLAGTTPGSGHDQLVVAGGSSLGGTLRATLVGGFQPQVGSVLTVLTGVTSGVFDAHDLPALAGTEWEVGSSPVTLTLFEAQDVLFADGFESGGTGGWSQVVPSEKARLLRFAEAPEWFDLLLNLEPETSRGVTTLASFPSGEGDRPRLAVERRTANGSVEVRVRSLALDGAVVVSPWSTPVSAPARLELHWRAAAPGTADGSFHVYGDGVLLVAVPALAASVDQTRVLELRAAEVVDLNASVAASYD